MADLRLNILGDSAQAVAAMSKAQVGVALLGKALVDFASSSVDAFKESEQADRRLALVAGESTAALKAQAEAIQASTGISGEHVQGLQAMLASYGQAPAEIDATVKAVLDLSAATGQDANSALQELLASTEGGRKAFKGLGIEFSDVGTKADVLRNATQALSAKFGGAAEAEGNTLAGRTRKTKEAFGDLKEEFGAIIVEFTSKVVAIDELTAAMQLLRKSIFGDDKDKKLDEAIAASKYVDELTARIERLKASGASGDVLADLGQRLEEAKAELQQLKKDSDSVLEKTGRAQNLLTKKGESEAKELADAVRRSNEEAAAAERQQFEEAKQQQSERIEYENRQAYLAAKEEERAREKKLEEEKRANKELNDERKKALAEQKKVLDEEARQWEAAGIAIGGALANALSQSLEALASGGEADAGAIMADVLAAIVSTAVSFIPGFGGFAGVAGQLTRTVTRAATNQGKRRHDGGWAMDSFPRYHLGNWVGSDEEMAILQNGERVLSRSEVAAMGGPKGVERAARGTSGSVVNIQTFDAGSFREMFSGRARQGIIDANRTGRGISSFFGGR